MLLRLLLLLLLLLLCSGLATGPVCGAAACAETKCDHCCADLSASCCTSGNAAAGETPRVAPTSVDLKQAIVPTLLCLGIQPRIVLPPVSVQERVSARLPVQPRRDVTCIRLI